MAWRGCGLRPVGAIGAYAPEGSRKQKTDVKVDDNALFQAQYLTYLVRQVRQVKGLLNKSTVAVV